MTQGHHPDYDALVHPQHALAHIAPQVAPHMVSHLPGGHAPPQHAVVPVHEVHQMLHGLRGDMAAIRAHQTQQPHQQPPAHYADHDHHERRDHERHEPRRREEQEYATIRRSRMRRPTEGPGKFRDFPIGFVMTAIAAGASEEIEVKPQVSFKGHRLAVAASIARYFNIVDIKVGKDSQLAATGEMPAEAFSALAVGVQMELDRAEPGIVITLIVRNTDTGPQDFGAVLYGEVEED